LALFTFAALTSISNACRVFGCSRPSYYKWKRYEKERGEAGLLPHPPVVHGWPTSRTPLWVEDRVLALKKQYPWYGCRRLADELYKEDIILSYRTVHRIIQRRESTLLEGASRERHPWQRFEKAAPHEMWQMDIFAAYKTEAGKWVYGVVILDDHSRYIVAARLSEQAQTADVLRALQWALERYGRPEVLLVDNGSQFRSYDFQRGCRLLEVKIEYCPRYWPRSKGKVERLIRTLRKDAFRGRTFGDLVTAQMALDEAVYRYNYVFRHQGIGNVRPAERLQERRGREVPADFAWAQVYRRRLEVRKVRADGTIRLYKQSYGVGVEHAGRQVVVSHEEDQGLIEADHEVLVRHAAPVDLPLSRSNYQKKLRPEDVGAHLRKVKPGGHILFHKQKFQVGTAYYGQWMRVQLLDGEVVIQKPEGPEVVARHRWPVAPVAASEETTP
jgi:transposase InsO family protein